MSSVRIIVADSATKINAEAAGAVVVNASHGGVYAAYLVAAVGVRASIFNDAGVGKDGAGIAGLKYLEELGTAAAAVGHDTARIGDGKDVMERGIISHANGLAHSLGCRSGMRCRDAASLLVNASLMKSKPKPYAEARRLILGGAVEVWCLDSVSLVLPEDKNRIVLTGSHGGLLGGKPETALQYDAVAAFFNDAGVGMDNAGISRLPALDKRGIPAATVSAASARIGDGRSTYNDGILSAVNYAAAALGGKVGLPARDFVDMIVNRAQRRK